MENKLVTLEALDVVHKALLNMINSKLSEYLTKTAASSTSSENNN